MDREETCSLGFHVSLLYIGSCAASVVYILHSCMIADKMTSKTYATISPQCQSMVSFKFQYFSRFLLLMLIWTEVVLLGVLIQWRSLTFGVWLESLVLCPLFILAVKQRNQAARLHHSLADLSHLLLAEKMLLKRGRQNDWKLLWWKNIVA